LGEPLLPMTLHGLKYPSPADVSHVALVTSFENVASFFWTLGAGMSGRLPHSVLTIRPASFLSHGIAGTIPNPFPLPRKGGACSSRTSYIPCPARKATTRIHNVVICDLRRSCHGDCNHVETAPNDGEDASGRCLWWRGRCTTPSVSSRRSSFGAAPAAQAVAPPAVGQQRAAVPHHCAPPPHEPPRVPLALFARLPAAASVGPQEHRGPVLALLHEPTPPSHHHR
jgi:hypothetical protein